MRAKLVVENGRNATRFLQNMFIIWFIQKKAISLSRNKLTF